jgi:hypothetical protein
MKIHDPRQSPGVWKLYMRVDASPQERHRQSALAVRRDEDEMLGPGAKSQRRVHIRHLELHLIELVQEVIGKVSGGLVDLVDQDDRGRRRANGLAECAVREVLAGVFRAGVARGGVVKPAKRIDLIEEIARCRSRFCMEFEDPASELGGNRPCERRLSAAWLAGDQERLVECEGDVHRGGEVR